MKYTMLNNCKMNWETEEHCFTFYTACSKVAAVDSLGDFIGSLKVLKDHIIDKTSSLEDIPSYYKVKGGCVHTDIQESKD